MDLASFPVDDIALVHAILPQVETVSEDMVGVARVRMG